MDTGRVITRTRPSLTCIPCKRRKVKCEKQRPACGQCRRSNIACLYETGPRSPVTISDQPAKRKKLHSDQKQNAQTGAAHPSDHLQKEPTSTSAEPAQEQPTPTAQQPPDPLAWSPDVNLDRAYILDGPEMSFFSDQHDLFTTYSNALDDISTSPSSYPSLSGSDSYPGTQASSTAASVVNQSYDVLARESRWLPKLDEASSMWILAEMVELPPKQMNKRQDGHGLLVNLSTPQSPWCRYVSSSFWAFAGNRIVDCDLVLQAQQCRFRSKHFNERQWREILQVLQNLPSKQLCDILVRSFFLIVRPLQPLVHAPSFQAEYDEFWRQYGPNRTLDLPEDIISHTSFFCLLWSVLYCGAVAASGSVLIEDSIQVYDSREFVSLLRTKLNDTLVLCCQTEYPTLSGLVASLMAHECDPDIDEFFALPPFISQSIQAAKVLGLHREEAVVMRNEVDTEIARRVWYHLIYLEVFATVSAGISLSYCTSEESYNTRMPHALMDSCMGPGKLDNLDLLSNKSSAMILCIGRFEFARTLRDIMRLCYNNHVPTKKELSILVSDILSFEIRIDKLISELEVRGLPEQGQISSFLLDANTVRQKHLYFDNQQGMVFNAYARILLCMMKHWVSIFFARYFLDHSNGDQNARLWHDQIQTCSLFLRNYLHLSSLPAFAPYRWLCPAKMQPLQECMIVLTHLKRHPRGSESQLLQYLLSEVFDIFKSKDPETCRSPFQGSLRHEALWEMLHQVYEDTREDIEKDGFGRHCSHGSMTQLSSSFQTSFGPSEKTATDVDMDRSRNSVTSSNLDHYSLFQQPTIPRVISRSPSNVAITANMAKPSSFINRTRSEDLTHNHYDHRPHNSGIHAGACTTEHCVTEPSQAGGS